MKQLFYPSEQTKNRAFIGSLEKYQELCDFAEQDPEGFWSERADEAIDWFKKYTKVMAGDKSPGYRWFEGGLLNASYLCVDRHLEKRGGQTALIWEGESGEIRKYTYRQLFDEVNKLADVLKNHYRVQPGDRVVLYMPMIPEAVFAMLACARIGAVHVVVFGGFSASVLGERIADTDAKLVITADGASRRGETYLLKPTVDEALQDITTSPQVAVVRHANIPIEMVDGRDSYIGELINADAEIIAPEQLDSEHPLFILHTSGSTGKPKGIVHSTAGYMLWANYTAKNVFDLHDGDVFWCTADIGWVTGHTYTVYGPLSLGGTTVIYEGVPTYPNADRWWQMIEKHQVTQFYTAPTAIRMLHRDAPEAPSKYDLSSLKILGTVGEPIDPDAWQWYYQEVGSGRCPIVDTWWQTETGGHVIAPLPGATPTLPGSATLPLPGLKVEVLDEEGSPVPRGEKGLLCITKPWPSMLRTVWGSPERLDSYFSIMSRTEGDPVYVAGDGAYVDENGYIVVTGRVDDVLNVSGHRVGTAELESVINDHPVITEVGVVSRPDEVTGERIVAFVVAKNDTPVDQLQLMKEVNQLLGEKIGKIIRLSELWLVPGLPKTRSGKIVRRILRSLAKNEPLTTDISTLEDTNVIQKIKSVIN